MSAEQLAIKRLRVRSRGGAANPVALRLGLEQALRQARPRPAHLPPSAILVIRALASRAPFGPAAGEAQRWRRQLEGQIGELARRAVRPARQYVPPQADVVLFDDEVDLLLCYTSDLLAGRWAWYWAELFPAAAHPGRPFGERLLAAWQAYPQAAPHTLVALRAPQATAALSRLNRSELSHLARDLHDTFALPRGALDAAEPEPARPGHAAGRPATAAPWAEWLSADQLRGLTPPAAYLLGLSYVLVHRLPQARGPEFGRQARRWVEEAIAVPPASCPWPDDSPEAARPTDPPAAPQASLSTAGSALAAGAPPSPTAGREPPTGGLTAAPAGETPIAGALEGGVFTRLGGAIYFINLMTRLGLPASIPALAELNPWELLGGLVAGLLGRRLEAYGSDPLWAALSALAGLEPGRPWGLSLPAPDAFRLPDAWTALLPPRQVAVYEDAAGRQRIWAAGPGYLLADLPAGASLEAWPGQARAGEPPLDFEERPAPMDQFLSPNLAWWVWRLRPFLSRLLAHLFDHPDAVETLLHQPATLYLSRTHVDLRQSVEQISIPLRRAGLDRTPGWRPEFGRVVTLHFE